MASPLTKYITDFTSLTVGQTPNLIQLYAYINSSSITATALFNYNQVTGTQYDFYFSTTLTPGNVTTFDSLIASFTTTTAQSPDQTNAVITNITSGTGTLLLPQNVNDTIVCQAFSATLSNKAFVADSTGFVNPSDNSIQLRFLPVGSVNTTTTIVTSQSSNITVSLPTSSDVLVGRATTDELINKTLTLPVISKIVNNSNTLTLPTTADYIVGRATTDTLTNKTITDNSNTVYAKGINTSGNPVTITSAAPIFGQVLYANTATTAIWNTLRGSEYIAINSYVTATTFAILNLFTYDKFTTSLNFFVSAYTVSNATPYTIRIYNTATNVILMSNTFSNIQPITYTLSQINQIGNVYNGGDTLTLPSQYSVLEIQALRTNITNAVYVYGVTVEY